MRSERKARISGLAGTEHARNRTLPDLTFPVTEWDLGTRLKEALKVFAFLTKPLKHTCDSPTDSWQNYFELEMLGILF